jgi:hypothetical protein
MKKNIYILISLSLIVAAVAGLYAYSHNCKQQLREVDRYALPAVVAFMKALSDWNLETLKPFLSDEYINSLTEEEWKSELDVLATLGKLESFARPNFVSHAPYKKYKICEYAIDMYSVASEFEKDNAVVRIFFENNCGKLKISSFIVTSNSIVVTQEYLEDAKSDGKDEESIEELTNEEMEGDLDSMYDGNQEDAPLPELDEAARKKVQKKLDENKNKPQGKAYRY